MLSKSVNYSNVVLIGSTSEIGLAIANEIGKTEKSQVTLVGRTNPNLLAAELGFQTLTYISVDFEKPIDFERLSGEIFSDKAPDLIIMAAGFLPNENMEHDSTLVQKTFLINSNTQIALFAALSAKLLSSGAGQILVISSVAAMRSRIQNFTYGASKIGLDYFALGFARKHIDSGVKVQILRPGYVFTKMSKDFRPAPFSISKTEVAKIAGKALGSKATIFYAPKILKYVMNILRILPRAIFDRLSSD